MQYNKLECIGEMKEKCCKDVGKVFLKFIEMSLQFIKLVVLLRYASQL